MVNSSMGEEVVVETILDSIVVLQKLATTR
jgi:hypothetical protein